MTKENKNGEKMHHAESEKITYNQLGFRYSQKSQSTLDAIEGYLEIVYDNLLDYNI